MAARAALALRWRMEITLITVAIVAAHVLTVSGTSHRTTLIRALITASVVVGQRETRSWVVDRAHCLLTRHRLYEALEEVRAAVGAVRLPLVLLVKPCATGERTYLWRRRGSVTAAALHERTSQLAAACWAKEAHVYLSPRWPAVLIVEVVRREEPADAAASARASRQ